jgi:uncharacterized spore protein YtfJ
MIDVEQILDAIGEELGGVAQGDAVVGSPVKLGPATIYPVSMISLGIAGGGGEGENEASEKGGKRDAGSGTGGGAGVKARPVAVIVFQQDEVSVLPVPHETGPLGRLLERIPDLVERFRSKAPPKP